MSKAITKTTGKQKTNGDLKKWADNFTELISEMDYEEINKYFEMLKNKWILPSGGYNKIMPHILTLFEIKNLSNVDIDVIFKNKNKILWEITEAYYKFISYFDNLPKDINVEWEKIFEKFHYSFNLIKNAYLLDRMTLANYEPSLNEDHSTLFKFNFIDYTKNTCYQNLLLYLLGCLNGTDKDQLARYQDGLFSKVYTPNGNFTHCWKFEKKIKNFIMDVCKKEYNFEQWSNLTASGNSNIKAAEQYILEYNGPELLVLEKDRHIFAFNNGLWFTKINIGTEEEPIWTDRFVKYEDINNNLDIVTRKTVAAKYFNVDFNNFDLLYENTTSNNPIPEDFFDYVIKQCPVLKSIMDYQEFPRDVQYYLCAFMGRNLYNIKEMENWQVVMYLLGQGGAGKSTLIEKVIGKFYESCDIKCLSNNVEKQFGIKPLADAFIVIAPEIMNNFKLEQTEWQLMVEGGTNTYAEKNKNAETITWTAPVPMAGNTIPDYKNNFGQFTRRIIIWKFWRKILETDTRLSEKLDKELPRIMKLCCMCYLQTVNKYSNVGVNKFLPEYFTKNQQEMEENTNTLISFLKSSEVILDPKVYIPEKIFKTKFNEFCRENNLPKSKFNSDFYDGPFSNYKIKVEKRTKRAYPINTDNITTGTFYVGVDIADDFNDSEPSI